MNQVEDKKITRCAQGHWYSAANYDSCPFCAKMGVGGGSANAVPPTEGFSGTNTVPLNNPAAPAAPAAPTAPAFGGQPMSGSTVPLSQPLPPTAPVASPQNVSTSPASSSASTAPASDGNKTIGMWATSASGKEPVVGWLVAVDGKHEGEDFRLKAGKNFIGRDRTMDVCLSNDNTVSRNKHSIIVYEPKSRIFIVQAGDARELSYLNDEIILEPRKINAFDKITVGSTTLMFVPLCGDNFAW